MPNTRPRANLHALIPAGPKKLGIVVTHKRNNITQKPLTIKKANMSPTEQVARDLQARNFRQLRGQLQELRHEVTEAGVKKDARNLRERLRLMKTGYIDVMRDTGRGKNPGTIAKTLKPVKK